MVLVNLHTAQFHLAPVKGAASRMLEVGENDVPDAAWAKLKAHPNNVAWLKIGLRQEAPLVAAPPALAPVKEGKK